MTEEEVITLEYLSKTILSGIRPYELEILRYFLQFGEIDIDSFKMEFSKKYGYGFNEKDFENSISVLEGKFVGNEQELKKYKQIDIIKLDSDRILKRYDTFANRLLHAEFYKQINDIVEVGLRRYKDKYLPGYDKDNPFVLYEKYSRRDVSFLMNCGRDLSSTMYGMKRIKDDTFIFVTYHKEESNENNYVDGKPDYADAFEDNVIFNWDSQIGRGVDSGYVNDVTKAPRKHLLVKKSDAETNFYYMGQFDVVNVKAAEKKDNKGKERDIAKIQMKLKQPVREDLLKYLQSKIQ
jgi:hypothetical protein